MKISIHQPQYLPWLPYFRKIEASDLFVFLDTVDFQKNGLQNRNQIKSPQGALWLTVPVRQRLGQRIYDTEIDQKANWQQKHLRTLVQCYGKAPYFEGYRAELEEIYSREWRGLSDLNVYLTTRMLAWLGINTPTCLSSEMASQGSASDLVLKICLEAGATCYISGQGGHNYLKLDDFERAGVFVEFQGDAPTVPYPQQYSKTGFCGNLSAIDILFNCGPAWRENLDKGTV